MPIKETILRSSSRRIAAQPHATHADRMTDRDRMILMQGNWHVAWTREHGPAQKGNFSLTNPKTSLNLETELSLDRRLEQSLRHGIEKILRILRQGLSPLLSGLDLLDEWRRRSNDRKLLREMDERMIKDIAACWHDVEREARKPFWEK